MIPKASGRCRLPRPGPRAPRSAAPSRARRTPTNSVPPASTARVRQRATASRCMSPRRPMIAGPDRRREQVHGSGPRRLAFLGRAVVVAGSSSSAGTTAEAQHRERRPATRAPANVTFGMAPLPMFHSRRPATVSLQRQEQASSGRRTRAVAFFRAHPRLNEAIGGRSRRGSLSRFCAWASSMQSDSRPASASRTPRRRTSPRRVRHNRHLCWSSSSGSIRCSPHSASTFPVSTQRCRPDGFNAHEVRARRRLDSSSARGRAPQVSGCDGRYADRARIDRRRRRASRRSRA